MRTMLVSALAGILLGATTISSTVAAADTFSQQSPSASEAVGSLESGRLAADGDIEVQAAQYSPYYWGYSWPYSYSSYYPWYSGSYYNYYPYSYYPYASYYPNSWYYPYYNYPIPYGPANCAYC